MRNFNKQEYNRQYYKSNRKYILLRKKLQKRGEEIPPVTRSVDQCGRIVVVFNDVIISVERSCL